ncbi:hypothetical protein [Caproiciproducens sp.]|uniref:hypothetical protein n=1 Tax=Caproiciproducens sp. TaxID=1954376 RepID=UPI00289BCEDA|nr:hypothetical protein [Caproiciproducens sp.]
MKLLDYSVHNFRSISGLHIATDGKNVNIYGQNGAGKTSTEDAFLWLLFGKDSADRKDYDLIPHKTGSPEPDIGAGREPVVEAKLEYFGKTVTLKKTYIEEWPKKGEFKGQYTGSKTHYFVDDLEVKAGEYNSVVSELIDPNLFKLLTNPTYFMENLHWEERRATLVKIAGDLDVQPAVALAELMGDRPFDNFYALSKQNGKSKQKELDGMPYAISEAQRLVADMLPTMPDVAALTAHRAELEEQIQTLKNDDSANAVRREIAEIETKIAEGRQKYNAAIEAENKKIQDGINLLSGQRREKSERLSDISAEIRRLEKSVADLANRKTEKLVEYHRINDSVWQGSEVCPTCGQSLPAEQVESARASFNTNRSKQLEKRVSEGKAMADEIRTENETLEKLQTESDALDSEIATLDMRIEKGTGMLKPCNYETQIECKQLTGRVVDLKRKLENGTDSDKTVKMQALLLELEDTKKLIDNARRVKLQHEQRKEQERRVQELQDHQKEVSAELGKWEKAVALCEDFVKEQARALETAVNGKFKIARFRMFSMQKNGEEAECCDVVYPNGSTNLSTGERLQTGIDIISTLSEYYGVSAPIWIDNAEGVTLPVETDAQVIRLIVSEKDEKLRVEVVE